MASNKSKFSQFGLHPHARVDIGALSPVARRENVRGAGGAYTQNSTVKTSLGPLGFAGTLESGLFSYTTLPIGGALLVKVVAYDRSADTEIVLTDPIDPETGTVREGKAFVLAATNVALDADDTIEIHTIADNNTVGTAQVGGMYSLMFKRTEDSVISD